MVAKSETKPRYIVYKRLRRFKQEDIEYGVAQWRAASPPIAKELAEQFAERVANRKWETKIELVKQETIK